MLVAEGSGICFSGAAFLHPGENNMKWADYGISAVRYDDDGNSIEKVKVHSLFEHIAPGVGFEKTK